MSGRNVLIVGGYGVVGKKVCELMQYRNPEISLWIAGRSQQIAADAATQFNGAMAVRIDVDDADPLAHLEKMPSAILAAANDADDNLLLAAARRGIPYVDITRWTSRLKLAAKRLEPNTMTAPVVLASGWMAGVAASVAAHYATEIADIRAINIDILYAMADQAGPNSVEYVDQLNVPFPIMVDGKQRLVRPLTEPRRVAFTNNRVYDCYRFDTPDQFTLVKSMAIPGVSTRLAYDSAMTTQAMRFLLRSGIWKLLDWPMLKGVRRALIYNPGKGAPHEIMIAITSETYHGEISVHKICITDTSGQTHMTAAGAVSQIERVLQLRGRQAPAIGVSYPEQATDLDATIMAISEMGVMITAIN